MTAWRQDGWAVRRTQDPADRADPRDGRGAVETPAWNPADVETRIYEAVDTLMRVPTANIQRNVTRWPEYVREACEAYGYGTVRVGLAPAAPDAITRLDETLKWLRWLPRAAQRILWSRANGLSWRRIAAFAGKSPNTCRAWYLAGLHHIAARLNGGGSAPTVGAAAPA